MKANKVTILEKEIENIKKENLVLKQENKRLKDKIAFDKEFNSTQVEKAKNLIIMCEMRNEQLRKLSKDYIKAKEQYEQLYDELNKSHKKNKRKISRELNKLIASIKKEEEKWK